MSELTFKIEYLNMLDKELENYICSLDGVIEVKTNTDKDEVYIKYDSKLISIKLLVMEVKLFLSLTKTPSIISFDKHSKQNSTKTSLYISDGCCEYCVKGFIEKLILIDGIERATADYEDYDFFNISIELSYDNELFNETTIKDLVKKYYD